MKPHCYEAPWVRQKTLISVLKERGPIVAGRLVGKRGSKGYDLEPLPDNAKARILEMLKTNDWVPAGVPADYSQEGHTGAPSGPAVDDDGF